MVPGAAGPTDAGAGLTVLCVTEICMEPLSLGIIWEVAALPRGDAAGRNVNLGMKFCCWI